ncbi:restriction endonuclease subunit S [Calothrix sp. PCC 7507]|uniref:restriction endonuclease subunit S n=1 Tax=Calothrix sp. PCC 7507 TaxID=99598 RepID=UPI00029F33FD|nr:restriction endonuclease subunit S [Calothrix sp. PCC 7507]AFY31780.1 restriction modification system DNA specificity domain protein [Calothrix sp. PCC 7507]
MSSSSTHFPCLPLSEAFWFQEGPGVRKWQFTNSGIKLLNVGNIEKQGKLNLAKTERHLSEEEVEKKYSHFLVDAGDLVIASSGISFDDDGLLRTRGAFVEKHQLPLCLNTSTIRFKAIEGVSNLCFLRFWLNGREFRSQITKLVTGTAQQNFGPSHLKAIKITLPPLEEQKRIAEILDRAEELRSKRREAIAQLDTLSQSIFLEMFGDPLSNPNNFPIQKLGELCSRVIDCPHSTPTYATKITPYACVRSSDIQNSELIFSDVKYLELEEYKKRIERGVPQQGDVIAFPDLVTYTRRGTALPCPYTSRYNVLLHLNRNRYIYCREGARFGNAALVTDDTPLICLGQRMMLFRPETSKANGEFIWGYLSNPIAYHQAVREVGGSASPHINIRDIIAFQIPVPPLNRQCEFAQRISAVNKLKASHRASLSELDALFASLQHRAFRGEL